MKPRLYLYLGFFVPIIFWTTTFVCGLILDNYNHLKWLVSELGALGTPTQYLFTTGLVLSAFLNIFFTIGLWKYCKKSQLSIIPILLLSFYSFIAGPAIFPMPLKLHSISGLPMPLMMASPLVGLWVWRKEEHLLKFRTVAIISLIIMMSGFLIFFPNVLNEYFGLKQRFLYTGWTLWSGYLSLRFLKLTNHKTEKQQPIMHNRKGMLNCNSISNEKTERT